MKNYLIYLIFISAIYACGDESSDEVGAVMASPDKSSIKNDKIQSNGVGLIDTIDYEYQEWYPGRMQLKIDGMLDKQNRRHGKWVFYSTVGDELSMTTYTHGLRQGFSIVKHPNGVIYYRGEYNQDKKVGLWTLYNEKGEEVNEINYDDE